MTPPKHHDSTVFSHLDPDSPVYRRVVLGSAVVVLAVALGILLWIGPREYRLLNQRIKQATLAHLLLTTLSCLVSLAAAAAGLLGRSWVYTLLSTCIAGAQLIDGVFTWERYRLLHPEYSPSMLVRVLVHAYIVVLLFLPFMTTWVFWAFERGHNVVLEFTHPRPTALVLLFCMLLYFASIPGRIMWDIGFGQAFIMRITELRVDAADKKQGALLLLSRKTVIYVIVSALLNLFIHVPHLRMIPYDAMFSNVFNLSYAILTHLCYSSGAGAAKWVGWRSLWPSSLWWRRTKGKQTAEQANQLEQPNPAAPVPPTAGGAASARAERRLIREDRCSVLSIPDPYTDQHPRPPLHQALEPSSAEEEDASQHGVRPRQPGQEASRVRPVSFIQDRESASAALGSPATASPRTRWRRRRAHDQIEGEEASSTRSAHSTSTPQSSGWRSAASVVIGITSPPAEKPAPGRIAAEESGES